MQPSRLEQEIAEQPQALARLLDEGWWAVVRAANHIRVFHPEWVVIAARGTSDNAARYAQYLFGAFNGLSVALAVPSLHTLYGQPPRLGRALTIGISQSGQSPDVVAVVEETRRQGGMSLAITNDPGSPLAAAAEHCVPLSAGAEHAVAATKTYTNELLVLAMLSTALGGDDTRLGALHFLPRAVEDVLATQPLVDRAAHAFRDADRFVVLGRGFNYCTAYEIALKMKETGYVIAEPYSVADFLHGPIAMVDRGYPAMVVAPAGLAHDSVAAVVGPLQARRARILALSDDRDLLRSAHSQLPLPRGIPEWMSPIVAIVPGQMFARSLAIARGIDPDQPRGLAKVTLTH